MNFIFIILILPAFGVLISADVVHAAVGGGVPCLVMVPSVPSVSVCCWFRHLVFIASGVPADIVGVWSMAALVLVFCAGQRISSGGWSSAVLGRVFSALRVPLVSVVRVCCLLVGSYAWGVMCYGILWCGRISF